MNILTHNSHEAYLHLLSNTPYNFDVIGNWDESSRPIPQNFNMISYNDALTQIKKNKYDLVIAHRQLEDFKLLKLANKYKVPSIMFFHANILQSTSHLRILLKKIYLNTVVKHYLSRTTNFAFRTAAIKNSFQLTGPVIRHGLDVSEYQKWNPDSDKMLLVCNKIGIRPYYHREVFKQFYEKNKIVLVGNNPEYENSFPAKNYKELRNIYTRYFAYFNILNEPETGYNLATLEAMATGMPIITMNHPESPISHGWNGLIVNNFEEAEDAYNYLLNNKDKAKEMGDNARKTVEIFFNIDTFKKDWTRTIENIVNH